MSWSYDSADLSTSTLSGQLNSTRFLLGDTNTNDQQVENEEVLFALAQNGYNIYKSAAWLARSLAAKYAKKVDIDLDGALSGAYSQLQEHFYALAGQLGPWLTSRALVGLLRLVALVRPKCLLLTSLQIV